ncbi:hypothetical protein TTHERM_00361690 (macronuclear) [Tetrahymena thermophila SB210]|uniref:Transmembrane protein n=1 Tax=Tetrahymena thermophila (strain SB210) TaxID=312017 RepID=Q22PH5_TETTS|nr:hypothetical protein TTHERM_00361690 [Tetrahymena thermophila SB210]EAR87134.2 hypothetical protein TTHERM_00361690 [Tetrahymena thermophila SB210]|eukprot:XP_001007379.2 hypothetical protein TTHERM_00361690 [Tetrahymena thermophila SB210]
MKIYYFILICSFFVKNFCSADNSFKDLSRIQRSLQSLENKQSQSQSNCPQNMCITFDKNSNTCLKCQQDQDPHKVQNDCTNKNEVNSDEQTACIVISVLNLLFVSILQYTWINISQKYKNNLVCSTQTNIKKSSIIQNVMNDGSPIQLMVGYPIQQAHNFQAPRDDAALENAQKVECQQMNVEQPIFCLEAQSISLSPPINTQQANQQNQLRLSHRNSLNNRIQQLIIQNEQLTQNNQTDSNQQIYQKAQIKYYGYQLTQAGNYSFKNFDNNHRIRHVIINFLALQFIFSKLLVIITTSKIQ